MKKENLTLEEVIRYADFEPRTPEAWKQVEKEAQKLDERLSKKFDFPKANK